MAILIKATGERSQVKPKGKKWTLEELQGHVGGYIQTLKIKTTTFVLNDGHPLGLPLNNEAMKEILNTAAASKSQYLRIRTQMGSIVGDVLMLEPGERF